MSTKWVRILLIVVFAAVAIPFGYARYFDGFAGGYPPAESLAGPMSDEWEDFAREVDRACARNYNAMQVDLDQVWELKDEEGWDDNTTSSAAYHVQSLHQKETYDEIVALGQPPARPEVFQPWLANVGRRAQLMEEISRLWANGESREAGVAGERLSALKIEANWLGQHFGLRICTSNGPGREPGESSVSYLEQVNDACLYRNRREDEVASRQKLTPNAILNASLGETIAISAIGPPNDQYELRRQILKSKKSLDRFLLAQLRKAARTDDFPNAWNRLAPLVAKHADGTMRSLQELGLTDCGNWGPAPAPSLLPG